MGCDEGKEIMTTVPPDDDGQRLDRWLKKKFPDIGFGAMQKLLRTGQVRVDGKRAKPDTRLVAGQELRLPPMLSNAEVAEKTSSAKDRDFIRGLVIYEDEDMVAINKPSGLAVQGGSGITRHIDGMLDALSGANKVRPKLVHRIDRETSGVLILARSSESARRLTEAFAGRDMHKTYVALTAPAPKNTKGRIDAPMAKGLTGPAMEKMLIDDDVGKSAITDYEVLSRSEDALAAFVAFHPLTGRTHQIRVHAAYIGCPLWGDTKYGANVGNRFYLHASSLTLNHPKTGLLMSIEAPIPADFQAQALRLGLPPVL
ncbi:MAG: RluA family pseudouridine synthase [Proteobacteria bacterium]|nr:RluA family pseudouridine synthase [Pseudomonadota bacterium]